jgi:hypothetical protein
VSWDDAGPATGSPQCSVPRILVIGHVATRWGLDHVIDGMPLEDLAGQPFGWQPGWEYRLP